MLELVEDTVPLRPDQVEWLARDRFNGSLTDIRQDNELISARLDRNVNNLIVVGTTPSIRRYVLSLFSFFYFLLILTIIVILE